MYSKKMVATVAVALQLDASVDFDMSFGAPIIASDFNVAELNAAPVFDGKVEAKTVFNAQYDAHTPVSVKAFSVEVII